MSSPFETVDGPPPTPFQRARRRRRRLGTFGGVAAAVVVGAVLLYVAIDPAPTEEGVAVDAVEDHGGEEVEPEDTEEQEGETDDAEEGEGETDDAEEFVPPDIDVELDDDGRPDTSVPDDEALAPPDVDQLEGDDRSLAELLLDVDASERAMLGFQLDVVAARMEERSHEAADEVDDDIRLAALHALESLAVLRGRMHEPVEDTAIEEVRDAYVVHLDSWVRWLEAIADEPQALNDQTGWFTIDINRTAAAFVRAVDQALSPDLDAEVVRFAEAILERGFPAPEDSPV